MFTQSTSSQGPTIEIEGKSGRKLTKRLPQPAQAKLARLRALRDDARTMVEASQARVDRLRAPDSPLVVARHEVAQLEKTNFNAVLRNSFITQGTPPDDQDEAAQKFKRQYEEVYARVDALEAELSEARNQLDARSKHWQAASKLVENLEAFIANAVGTLTVSDFTAPASAKGQDAETEIDKLRDLLAALHIDRKRVLSAAIPANEAKDRVRTFVHGRAAKVRVGGLLSRDRPIGVSFSKGDEAFNIACFLDPSAVIRRLEHEIDAELAERTVMTELEQARELKKLDDKLLLTARREEALIVTLEQAGVAFQRRPAADPRAVLGVA